MNQLNSFLQNFNISEIFRFSNYWSTGELLRYRLLSVIGSWFSLNDFELFPGLVFGDTDLLTSDTKDTLKTLGIMHALSASGTNVSLVVYLANTFLPTTSRYLKACITIGVLLGYLALVGKSAPIIRAVLARLYLLLAWYKRRQASGLIAWFFSAITMLVIDTRFATQVSYQLSILASLGIAVLVPRLSVDNHKQPGRLADVFREAFWQTAAAQFFVLPLTLTLFGESQASSLLTNTILAPFLTYLTLAAFFLTGFGAFYSLALANHLDFLLIPLEALRVGAILIYRLINQSFITVLNAIHYQAAVINSLIPIEWVILTILLLFAFHFGRNYRRVRYSLKLVQRY